MRWARCSSSPRQGASIRARSSCSGPTTRVSRQAVSGFADVGAAPAWRNLRPARRDPRDATQVRIVMSTTTSARNTGSRSPRRASAAAHPAGRRRLAGPCAAGLARQDGVPMPAPVRSSVRGRRGAEWRILPDRFGRSQFTGDGQPRRRTPGHHRTAAAPHDGADLFEGRLVPRLGRAATAHAVLPERPTGTAGSRFGNS